ncbi:unnamed protein product [Phyllotreta striolata]|uniref:PNPLA domain-containing protein n=1 Tax=Phyllotreta striolata TaxID=444603 RepID=A0A9N9TW31_PHYSR|nr:unnamed protein product [Phyllotreta striolata]
MSSLPRCARVGISTHRQISSGPSNLDSAKMHVKNMVLTQWKLINGLKFYLLKLTNDKTLENALNTEFAQFLQKINFKIPKKEMLQYFASDKDKDKDDSSKAPPADAKDKKGQSIQSRLQNIPGMFSSLNIGMKTAEEKKKESMPNWKCAPKPVISKESIASRTCQVITSIKLAESDHLKMKRIEDLVAHLERYPLAKHHAVKDGAIRALLRIREGTKEPNIQGSANLALALLGHTDIVPGAGLRILSIDGGGTRGILVIEMLKKLEEFTKKPVHEMFDFICGVSTGAILACLIGLKHKTLDEVSDIYKNISTQIFTQSALAGTSNLVWSHSYYDTALWEKLLKDQWQDQILIHTRKDPRTPKFCAVSAVVNHSRLTAYVFRNYSLPVKVQSQYCGNYNHYVWEAIRASAAAPTYFEECKIDNMLHQDGGILVNNPTAVAIHEARLLWPRAPIQCVISFGTGRTAPNPMMGIDGYTCSSWKTKFLAILDSATDTEGVHTMLSDLLPTNVYFRFNPYLTEMLNIAEIHPQKLEQLKRDALMYLRRNEDKFQNAAEALSRKKGIGQKGVDWISKKREMYGF